MPPVYFIFFFCLDAVYLRLHYLMRISFCGFKDSVCDVIRIVVAFSNKSSDQSVSFTLRLIVRFHEYRNLVSTKCFISQGSIKETSNWWYWFPMGERGKQGKVSRHKQKNHLPSQHKFIIRLFFGDAHILKDKFLLRWFLNSIYAILLTPFLNYTFLAYSTLHTVRPNV